jgi:hypothetical protein
MGAAQKYFHPLCSIGKNGVIFALYFRLAGRAGIITREKTFSDPQLNSPTDVPTKTAKKTAPRAAQVRPKAASTKPRVPPVRTKVVAPAKPIPAPREKKSEAAVRSKSPPAPKPKPRPASPVPAREDQLTILPQHIRAAQSIYFASLFEYLNVFRVLDLVAQALKKGKLRALDEDTRHRLQRYADAAPARLTEQERRNLYTQALGIPGGDAGSAPNNEFGDLWLRFISAVSACLKQKRVRELLRNKALDLALEDAVRDPARRLAANLSLYGGAVFLAAQELQKQITEISAILSEPKLQAAYGVDDMWQLLERVAHLEWGEGADSARYRAMASSAAVIMAWLAKNAARLWKRPSKFERPNSHLHPTDAELILECERWLDAQKPDKKSRARKK